MSKLFSKKTDKDDIATMDSDPPVTEDLVDTKPSAPEQKVYFWQSATHTCFALADNEADARELCAPGHAERVRQFDMAQSHSGGAIQPNLLDNTLRQDPRILTGACGYTLPVGG